MSTNFEQKSLSSFIESIKRILNLSAFKTTVDDIITEQYTRAIQDIDSELDLQINLVPKGKDLNFLLDYVNQNIQSAADQVADNIRQEIQRGILNGETTDQLAKRIKFLFKEKKYHVRIKAILRTETLRANNLGTLEGAHQAQASGLKLTKWLDVTEDTKTSKICHAEHSKYGTPEQAIPLDKEFVVKADNKTIKSQYPPFHVNCRTVLRIKNERS